MRKLGEARRLGRLERPALAGVLVRDIINFQAGWKAITFGATVQPIVYLLAFGFGFGTLVDSVGGHDYVDFVGTGIVATAVLFSSAFPGMFNTFVKYKFQRSYDSILAAPVDTEELVTAEMTWIAIRAGVFGVVPMIIAVFFGLDPSWGMLLVPFIAFIAGFGWAGFGVSVAAKMNSIDSFSYIVSAVLTPLFLVAGTFFPIDGLPEWAQVAAQINPLYHLVELVRSAVFGFEVGSDAVHLAVLVVYGLLTWRLAIAWLERRVIV